MRERDEEILVKEQARHIMLAPLRGQQLKNYVSGIRNQLNAERTAEKKAAYTEAMAKWVHFYILIHTRIPFLVLWLYCHSVFGFAFTI